MGSVYNFRGRAHYNNGDYDKAMSDYGSALRHHSSYVSALMNRAEIYAEWGNHRCAATDFDHAVEIFPGSLILHRKSGTGAYNGPGLGYVEEGDHEYAIRHFRKASEIDPLDPTAFEHIGRAFEAMGQISQAARHFEIAHRLVHRLIPPEMYDYDVSSDRAMEHFASGNYDLAIAWESSAISLDPLDEAGYYCYYYRGVSYLAAGSYVQAVADFNTAIGLAASGNGHPLTWSKRNEAYSAMGDDPATALPFLKRGVFYMSDEHEAPNDSDLAVINFASINHYPGLMADSLLASYKIAIADFDTALHFDPRNVEAYRGRGIAYRFTGEDELAEEDFTAADDLGGS